MPTVMSIGFVSTEQEEYPYKQVAACAEALLRTIRTIERLAERKQFRMTSAHLCRFDRVAVDGRNHSLRVMGDEPIDETYVWQVYGTIGGRQVNVISQYIFHTHKENRSGSGALRINGKDSSLKPKYGGVVLDDI